MKTELEMPPDASQQHALFGVGDANLRTLRSELGVRITPRGERILIEGEDDAALRAEDILRQLMQSIRRGRFDSLENELEVLLEVTGTERSPRQADTLYTERLQISGRTAGQKEYIQAIRDHTLVFATGPAGTGKTFLAVAAAVEALRHGRVRKLILTRPAVEAGERIGFLPGDLKEKVDPYLRPIYDALYAMISRRQLSQYMETGMIEVAPLAFMRGRTLERCFVIMDEAQNTTPLQMKMFLTRLGLNSRAIVTGDMTQVDLAPYGKSGLHHALSILTGIDDIAVVHLTSGDIVRHPLVREIVQAYAADAEKTERAQLEKRAGREASESAQTGDTNG